MKIAQGSINIAGQMSTLARLYREAGHECSTIDYHPSYMGQAVDVTIPVGSMDQSEARRCTSELARQAFAAHDVFGFWFGTSLMLDGSDLPHYRAAGKRVVMHHVGSDVRTPDAAFEVSRFGGCKPVDVEHQRSHLANLAEHIDVAIVHNPAIAHYAASVGYRTTYMVPIPIDLDALPLRTPPSNPRPLVMHAPTSRDFKGTDHVLAAVATLKAEGLDFDFELVEGVSHADALARYRCADLVVDQIRAGGYGTLSMECAAMGIPCITHISEWFRERLPEAPPLIDANPDTIADVLRRAIGAWEGMGLSQAPGLSRGYVERYHDARKVAATLLDIYSRETHEDGHHVCW